MGDRANIQHVTDEGTLTLYSHWGGRTSPTACKLGLLAAQKDEYGQSRWDDPSFGVRLFLQGIGNAPDGWLSRLTVGNSLMDNERPVLIVEWEKQSIRCTGGTLRGETRWTFAQFVKLPDLTWEEE